MKPEIVPATPDLIRRFYGGEMPKRTVRALMLVVDGEPVVIGGYYTTLHEGDAKAIVFSEDKDGALRRYAKSAVRMGWRVMGMAFASGAKVYAGQAAHLESSRRFIQHFGFVEVDKGVFQCN